MNRRTLLKSPLVFGASAWLAGCGAPAVPSPQQAPDPSRVLVAYFSRAGENYYYGGRTNLEVGNTQVVADMIASSVTVDVYRIEAADPYPTSYDATVERNKEEQNTEARPQIAGSLPSVENVDAVLLGSPIWNVRPPMIMRTFVENVDLTGKTIFPFVTYAVSGLGNTVDDYTRLCPQSTIGEALAVRGEEARDARADVQAWLRKIGLVGQT
jgi:flavodoxin